MDNIAGLLSLAHGDREAHHEMELVRAANGGDEDALEELVRTTQGAVWRFCRHMLGESEEAYDATQETFLRVLRSLPSFRGDSRLLTWMLTIARRVCAGRLRERIERRNREQEALELVRDDPDPHLQMAIDDLAPALREALVLTQIVGLSYDEAAATLGCSAGTVKSRVFRARLRLTHYLRS